MTNRALDAASRSELANGRPAALTSRRRSVLARAGAAANEFAGFLVLLALVVVLWEALSRTQLVDAKSLPPLTTVLYSFGEQAVSGTLGVHVITSLYRILMAFVTAAICGVGIGMTIGWFRGLSQWVEPIIYVLYPIPKIAFLSLFFTLFGLGTGSTVAVAAVSAFFVVTINTIVAVRNVSPVLVRAAMDLGVSQFQLLRDVIFPASLPVIFGGLRLSVGTTFIAVLAMEMIVSADRLGIGYFISFGTTSGKITLSFVGAFAAAILGVLSYFLFVMVERRAMPWSQSAAK